MASLRNVTVLEPSSLASLNTQSDFSAPALKKRKRFHEDGKNGAKCILSSAIDIQPYTSSLSDKTETLIPIILLPRSRLPLSWLDPCPNPPRSIAPGKLFVSNILALEIGLQDRGRHVVLVARLRGEKHSSINFMGPTEGSDCEEELYVVERVKKGIYSVCPLGRHIREGDVIVASKGWKPEGTGHCLSSGSATGEDDWFQRAKILHDFEGGNFGNLAINDVTLVFDQWPGITGSANITEQPESVPVPEENTSIELGCLYDAIHQGPENSFGSPGQKNIEANSPCPRDILDNLKTQYLETLYISKASVAYFAKGPLSRARAAFQSAKDTAAMRVLDLYYFYRECIMPVKRMDIKYRDSVPEVVRNFALGLAEGGKAAVLSLKGGKRKNRKRKIGRNGLYPDERDLIARWWSHRNVAESPLEASSGDEELKQLVADLRFRETQLQILLILEAMSLELSMGATDGNIPELELQVSRANKVSKKKAQDLGMLLELLVDRLCIWHTVSSNDPVSVNPVKRQDKGKENDKLRDFCTEVIVPFYASRLPEQCRALSGKLGGPISASPKRPTILRQKSSADSAGETVKKQNQRSRRTLQRVLTDEKAAITRLNAAVPKLKRESSEPDFQSLVSRGRGGIQKPRRIDNREIDLDAVARQHETKLRKMAMLIEQKKELDAAINALRKPNRELVARDWADSAEKRASIGSSRKQKDPIRNPLGEGVQVIVTPKGLRKKDCETSSVPSISRRPLASNGEIGLSTSFGVNEQVIQSSALRSHNLFGSRLNPKIIPKSVQETPSKRSSQIPVVSSSTVNTQAGPTGVLEPTEKPFKVPGPLRRGNFKSSAPGFTTPTKPPRSHINNGVIASYAGYNMKNDNESTFGVEETPPQLLPRRLGVSKTSGDTSVLSTKAVDPITLRTPIKCAGSVSNGSASPTVQVSINSRLNAEKSIYDQLGWDNDEEDDDELALC
ncbi:uncharacterized protein CIMG_08969 [Coccidioides immitis RS]|uniref:DNA replication regulator Sld3 C-terminal domain-containing protein n=3 Tax=Coccidioides immitis TaxID=5501 RepID=J3K1C5_COCIM|nr:uncharacterized protein CIMG_08969 [Coccidioides immitis RS]EAS27765.3 hypothetical protein CIMG_08969 [Coccidioides immitis RS]KMP08548.1 hypothetical protein CIRG_08228 [Coccidioides immitis RMSCC 2394]KMU73020.1 hypothetical protein CISG_09898 [Coccidioides immitis RMSCC 3703]